MWKVRGSVFDALPSSDREGAGFDTRAYDSATPADARDCSGAIAI